MKNVFISFVFILFSSQINGQTYSKIVSDKDIEIFIKQNFKSLGGSKIIPQITKWDSTFFDKDDYDYLKTKNDTVLTTNIICDFKLQYDAIKINSNLRLMFIKEKKHKKYCRISIPLFDSSKQYAIIQKTSWYGDEGSNGGVWIFKRIHGKWKKIDIRHSWIS